MSENLKENPLLNEIRTLLIKTKNPSVSFVQRTFKLGYGQASDLVAALEGEIVTEKDPSGWRKMLIGPTVERD